ncbi:hypothetical protein LCI18_005743 [Fusarium solani-melongenae]|uniref:Uncharacterized protein n=1 Tax=Fusarium solani subsp. cucurbitae TaxID=2747967 RepID=A0ACD3Z0N3_FUSSC|nr:hypothetical protein LCI18_005743 [Fusarium solani-melongenae]
MAHQFKSDFQFDMDNCFSYTQSMSYPYTSSFSSASSSYDPFTPTRFSSPYELSALEPDGSYNISHGVDAAPRSAVGDFMLDAVVETKLEHIPFPDCPPNTPMKQELVGLHYREIDMEHNGSMGSITPSSPCFPISPGTVIGATSFVMTPTQMSSGFEATEIYSPWSCASDSPVSYPQSNGEVLNIDHQSESPYYVHNSSHVHESTSPRQIRPRQMVVDEIQRKTAELQHAQTRRPRKRSVKPDSAPADPVWSSCDYPGCNKAFRRKEHLKRHKQSYHGEGPNRFSCEFCGRGQFNRKDNLNNHRRLHTRHNSRNRGVEFVPNAVMVIEQEKLRRTPTRRRKQGAIGGASHREIPTQ